MAYVFTLWTCYALYNEYRIVTKMRLHFLAAERRRPDQFTVSNSQQKWAEIYDFEKKVME